MIVMIAHAPAKIGRDPRRVVREYGDICPDDHDDRARVSEDSARSSLTRARIFEGRAPPS
jgi:hypothetical protein